MKIGAQLTFLARFIILPSWKTNARGVWFTISSVALGVALVVAISNANDSILAQFKHSSDLIAGKTSAILTKDGEQFIAEELGQELLLKLRDYDCTPMLEVDLLDEHTGNVLKILGVDLLNDYRYRQYALYEADLNPKDLLEDGAIILPRSTAQRWNWSSNTTRTLDYGSNKLNLKRSSIELKDEGLVQAEAGLIALTDVGNLQRILKAGDVYTGIAFLNADPSELIQNLNLPLGFSIKRPAELTKDLDKFTEAFRMNLEALSFIALIVAGYLVFQTSYIRLAQKLPFISTLRVMGLTRGMLLQSFIIEAIILGILGSALGVIGGLWLAQFIQSALTVSINQLYLNANGASLILSPRGIVLGLLSGMICCIVATLPVALTALSKRPALNLSRVPLTGGEANRKLRIMMVSFIGIAGCAIILYNKNFFYNLPGQFSGFAIILVALSCGALLFSLPLWISSTIFRYGNRWFAKLLAVKLSVNFSRLWIAGIALLWGLTMTIAITIAIDGFRITMLSWLSDTIKSDIYISSRYRNSRGIDSGFASALNDLSGLKSMQVLRSHDGVYEGKPAIFGGVDLYKQYSTLKMLDYIEPEILLAMPKHYAFVSNTFANKHNVNVGNQVYLRGPTMDKTLFIGGVYQDYSSEHGYVLMQDEVYREVFKRDAITNISIDLLPGANIMEVKSAIERLQSKANVSVDVQANSELRENVLNIFNQTFQVSYLFFWIAFALSVITVAITMISCVEDNRKVNSIQRYIGVTNKQMLYLEMGQGMTVTILALMMSIPMGYWVADILKSTVNARSFGWIIDLHINWLTISGIGLLAICGGVLGGMAPLLWSNRKS